MHNTPFRFALILVSLTVAVGCERCNVPILGSAVNAVTGAPDPEPKPKLAPLADGWQEEKVALAGDQALVLRVADDGSFAAVLVDRGTVLDKTESAANFFAISEADYRELECERYSLESRRETAGSHNLELVSLVCERGADARLFQHLTMIFPAPTRRLSAAPDLNPLFVGKAEWMENVHDMCITGHKLVLVEEGGALQMTFEPFAEFQPDEEFGAVEKEECVPPEPRPSVELPFTK